MVAVADFATSVALSFEVDNTELRAVRDEIEAELDTVSVGVETGGTGTPVTDGGLDVGTLTTLAEDRNDLLDDILDELETGGVGGGGGGGLPIPGLGGGGGGGGFSLLEALGVGSLASGGASIGGATGLGGAIVGLLAANELASAQAEEQTGVTASDALTVGGPGGGGDGTGTGFLGPDLIANQITDTLGVGNSDSGDDEVAIDVPEILDRFQTQSPEWLSRFDDIVSRLNNGLNDASGDNGSGDDSTSSATGIDPTEGGDRRLARLAGNDVSDNTVTDAREGGDERLARAAANQRADNRADRGPDATRGRPDVNVSVQAEGVGRREVERAMDEAKQEAVREIEQQFRESQRR
ncbi:hypothetical protein OSG_eHP31_00050 [environmental Halophage eHP-31]|nr:hypothetical protein OSG_eHP31_00050 [environmental Halophage eHP-31]